MTAKVLADNATTSVTLERILREGYGPGAWHGADLKAAIADVTSDVAYRRPAKGRHNIAEIALHHAWVVRNVLGQLTRRPPAAFPLEGEDWFTLNGDADLPWPAIVDLVGSYHSSLESAIGAGELQADGDPLDVVLGVTCHAVYHAGQIQLIRKMME